jgi:FixJ family two-component response regulator
MRAGGTGRTWQRTYQKPTTQNRYTGQRKTFRFKPWTPQEVKTLRQMYRDMPTKDVARKLGRSISSVQGKAGMLGLHKTTNYMKRMRSTWN